MVKQARAKNTATLKAPKKPIAKPQKPASPVAKKLNHNVKGVKWDVAQLKAGQFVSATDYLTVVSLGNGKLISVKSQNGTRMEMSKELLETMYSGTHFCREVDMNMTGLAELLQSVQDNIFTVIFKKQATEEAAAQVLINSDKSCFKDAKKMAQLAKEIIQGQTCSLTCHMVQVENNLGRSLVIDLNQADGANAFRQVDHRTIESIIFKNTKYSLKRGGKSFDQVDIYIPKGEAKWDAKQLAVGNMFSGTSYYEILKDLGNGEVKCNEKGVEDGDLEIDKELLYEEMHHASLYESEEQLSRTDLALKLTEANNMCFTVCFDTKATEKSVAEGLAELKKAPNAKIAKELAKKCLVGHESTLLARLSKAEGKLGRSLVVDLPTQGYRQIDHRTLKWLVINNVKYVLKK